MPKKELLRTQFISEVRALEAQHAYTANTSASMPPPNLVNRLASTVQDSIDRVEGLYKQYKTLFAFWGQLCDVSFKIDPDRETPMYNSVACHVLQDEYNRLDNLCTEYLDDHIDKDLFDTMTRIVGQPWPLENGLKKESIKEVKSARGAAELACSWLSGKFLLCWQ